MGGGGSGQSGAHGVRGEWWWCGSGQSGAHGVRGGWWW